MFRRNRSVARSLIRLGLLLVASTLLAGCSFERDQLGGFRFEETYRLRSGESLDGDQVWVGSNLALDQGSAVNGSVTLIGDRVTAGGLVSGDLTAIASDFTLDSTARITGDLTYCADRASIHDRAQVDGERRNECTNDRCSALDRGAATGGDRWQPTFLTRLLGVVGRTLFLGGVAGLGTVLFPAGLRRMSFSMRSAPYASAGIGFLTLVAAGGISAVYVLSLILVLPLLALPLFLLVWLALGLALLLGWAAFAHPVGGWILRRAGVADQPPMVQAVVGGLALGVAVTVWDLFGITSWIGWLAALIVSAIALGAVILTRLGTRAYPRRADHDILAPHA